MHGRTSLSSATFNRPLEIRVLKKIELLGDYREPDGFGPKKGAEAFEEEARPLGGLRNHLVKKRLERGAKICREPKEGLRAGDVGVIVEHYPACADVPDGYELEVFAASGQTIAVVSVPASAVREATEHTLTVEDADVAASVVDEASVLQAPRRHRDTLAASPQHV